MSLLPVRVVVVRTVDHLVVVLLVSSTDIASVVGAIFGVRSAIRVESGTVAHALAVIDDIIDIPVVAVRLSLLGQAETPGPVGEVSVIVILVSVIEVVWVLDGARMSRVLSHGGHLVSRVDSKEGWNVGVFRDLRLGRRERVR